MFSKAFRNSPSGMFIAALHDSRIINVNDSFLSITGYSLLDIIGRELLRIGFFHHFVDGKKMMGSLAEKSLVKIIFYNGPGRKTDWDAFRRTGHAAGRDVHARGDRGRYGNAAPGAGDSDHQRERAAENRHYIAREAVQNAVKHARSKITPSSGWE